MRNYGRVYRYVSDGVPTRTLMMRVAPNLKHRLDPKEPSWAIYLTDHHGRPVVDGRLVAMLAGAHWWEEVIDDDE